MPRTKDVGRKTTGLHSPRRVISDEDDEDQDVNMNNDETQNKNRFNKNKKKRCNDSAKKRSRSRKKKKKQKRNNSNGSEDEIEEKMEFDANEDCDGIFVGPTRRIVNKRALYRHRFHPDVDANKGPPILVCFCSAEMIAASSKTLQKPDAIFCDLCSRNITMDDEYLSCSQSLLFVSNCILFIDIILKHHVLLH